MKPMKYIASSCMTMLVSDITKLGMPKECKGVMPELWISTAKKILDLTKKFPSIKCTIDSPTVDKWIGKDKEGNELLYLRFRIELYGYKEGYDWIGPDNPKDIEVNDDKNWKKLI